MVSFETLIRQKLGLTLRELTPQEAKRFGIPAGEGLVINEVEKGGPSEHAQLQHGYLMGGVDGQNVGQLRTVVELLAEKKKGEAVQIEVIVPRRLGASFMEFRRGRVEIQLR